MAYIAFDLDNTIGFFELTNPFGLFWGPDRQVEGLSPKLQILLQRARKRFAESLLKRKDLLFLVLRPYFSEWLYPILTARREEKIKSILIYSNTTSLYSLELAKTLIEKQFGIPGLISLTADAYHPLRGADLLGRRHPYRYVEPLKQFATLERLFQSSIDSRRQIHPSEVLFLDDRPMKHVLKEEEEEGLTYLLVAKYRPKVTTSLKKELVTLALKAIDAIGLLSNEEYLNSAFCFRTIIQETGVKKVLRGFPDLFSYVVQCIEHVPNQGALSTSNDLKMLYAIQEFLQKF